MTETEWLTSRMPDRLWRAWVSRGVDRRRGLLVAAAVCRRFPELLHETNTPVPDGSAGVLDLVEELAEQQPQPCKALAQLQAHHDASRTWSYGRGYAYRWTLDASAILASGLSEYHPAWWNTQVGPLLIELVRVRTQATFDTLPPRGRRARNRGVRTTLCDLIRDLAGNPFRDPVSLDPAWLRWRDGLIVHLARSAYESRSFDAMPILGDALEEAGCTDPDVLAHCRQHQEHARGCWVLDLVLGMGGGSDSTASFEGTLGGVSHMLLVGGLACLGEVLVDLNRLLLLT